MRHAADAAIALDVWRAASFRRRLLPFDGYLSAAGQSTNPADALHFGNIATRPTTCGS